ncbi:MAG: amidophosphoribosyltransferase [Candidatus Micrarchaeia archaeon]
MKKLKEECGVAAIILKTGQNISYLIYESLLALQHRGQDASGFVVYDNGKLERRIGLGLVSEAFNGEDLKFNGTIAIGHTRYPTTGRCKLEDVQPVFHNKMALAHNGHISNYSDLKKELEEKGYTFKGTVDSEPLLYILDYELKNKKTIEGAIETLMKKVIGSYSVVWILEDKLVVFRDPHAIRPLVYGKSELGYAFASESAALDINGFEYVGSVAGGELIIIQNNEMSRKIILQKEKRNCMFEYVYFSRTDSIINDKLVNDVRKKLGEIIADEHPVNADVVVPVPDTSRTAALAFSYKTGIPYEEGLIKNRYVGRTFIMNSQEKRRETVKRKLNPIKKVIEGKRVVLFDDSIVRGTTMKEIVRMVRGAGACEVHLRITCPPVRAPCFYGVDMPSYKELIGSKKSIKQIEEYLNVESLGYISMDGLLNAIGSGCCAGCLNEEYFSDYVLNLAKKVKENEGILDGCNKC